MDTCHHAGELVHLRDRWVWFHWLRTLAGMAAFACALVPLVR